MRRLQMRPVPQLTWQPTLQLQAVVLALPVPANYLKCAAVGKCVCANQSGELSETVCQGSFCFLAV